MSSLIRVLIVVSGCSRLLCSENNPEGDGYLPATVSNELSSERILKYLHSNDLVALVAAMEAKHVSKVLFSTFELMSLRVAYLWFRVECLALALNFESVVDAHTASELDRAFDDTILPTRIVELVNLTEKDPQVSEEERRMGPDASSVGLETPLVNERVHESIDVDQPELDPDSILSAYLWHLAGEVVEFTENFVTQTRAGYYGVTEDSFKLTGKWVSDAVRALFLAAVDKSSLAQFHAVLSRLESSVAPLLNLPANSGWDQQPTEWVRNFLDNTSELRTIGGHPDDGVRRAETGRYILASGRLNYREELQKMLLAEVDQGNSASRIVGKGTTSSTQAEADALSAEVLGSETKESSLRMPHKIKGPGRLEAMFRKFMNPRLNATLQQYELALFLDLSLIYSGHLAKLHAKITPALNVFELQEVLKRLSSLRCDLGGFRLRAYKRYKRACFSHVIIEGGVVSDSLESLRSGSDSDLEEHTSGDCELEKCGNSKLEKSEICSPESENLAHPKEPSEASSQVQAEGMPGYPGTPPAGDDPAGEEKLTPSWLKPLNDRLAYNVKGTMYETLRRFAFEAHSVNPQSVRMNTQPHVVNGQSHVVNGQPHLVNTPVETMPMGPAFVAGLISELDSLLEKLGPTHSAERARIRQTAQLVTGLHIGRACTKAGN